MEENKKIKWIIIAGISAMVFIMLILAGTITLVLVLTSEDEGSDENQSRQVAEDFIKALDEGDSDLLADILMDEDGNFIKDTDPESLEEIDDYFFGLGLMTMEIEDMEKTEWTAQNTGPIYIYTIKMSMGGEESTYPLMVAENLESGEWGCSLEGFDLDITGDHFENDNTPESATEISEGRSEGHNIHVESDVDYFRFDMDSYGQVRITTHGDFGGDTELYLYDDPDSYHIEHNDDRDEDMFSEIETDLEPGTYYVKVISYDESETVMDYTLELNID